ncbi:MAG TPA: periplasmic heavy metal sensor [Candidatus Methylomirabilis sp.]|nr:periplasmic heavy metal sensor [Candidatus Methylomirabilis sp.]
MSDTAETPRKSVSADEHPRRRFFRRAAVAAAIAGVTAGLGIKAFAHADGPRAWHRGAFLGAALDPAMLDERLDRMLKHLYVEVDATDAQKQLLGPIVKSAASDLLPLRTRMRDARQQAVTLLSQEHVDRAALETLRAEQLQLAEQASRRLTQALADVADVLTVAQRKQLAERMGRWHGHRG